METSFLIKGIIIGFSIAAPVGPIGVLCIRRTLADGRVSGLVSGLGAAVADAVYGCIAGFGLTFVSGFLIGGQAWLRIVGGVFLCFLGIRTFLSGPAEKAAPAAGRSLAGAFVSTFLLTLTNPMTILSFVGIFAGLGIAGAGGDYGAAGALVLGVFSGSALWWLLLSGGVGALREKVTPRGMQWVNRGAGAIIAAFGLLALLG
ncbi:MAG TPA: LysE family transporter [Syntrophales bacterium]|nr:LysE family transporter [Syntrophales bacterium]